MSKLRSPLRKKFPMHLLGKDYRQQKKHGITPTKISFTSEQIQGSFNVGQNEAKRSKNTRENGHYFVDKFLQILKISANSVCADTVIGLCRGWRNKPGLRLYCSHHYRILHCLGEGHSNIQLYAVG